MRQVLAEALEPIHPVILLEVPSVTRVPVFLPVLLVTLEVPLPLFFLSLLPFSVPFLLLSVLAVLAALRRAPSYSMWYGLAGRPLSLGLGYLDHRLWPKISLHVIKPLSLSVRSEV